MPTYLCHGFRWQRRSILVYVVVQNLEDASPQWIIPARSSACILESFYSLFEFLPYCRPPTAANSLSLRGPYGPNGVGDSDDESYGVVGGGGVYANNGGINNNGISNSAVNGGSRSRSESVSKQSQRSRSKSRSRSRARQTSNPPRRPSLPSAYSVTAGTDAGGAAGRDEIATQDWSLVKLLEEYDPSNLDEVSRPYAYVADHVVRIDTSVSIVDEIQRYEDRVRNDADPPMSGVASDDAARRKGSSASSVGGGGGGGGGKKGQQLGWFEKLRDQLQRGEDIRWYVVVNGDEVRSYPEPVPSDEKAAADREALRLAAIARQQQIHHAQYSHQQLIFESKDRTGPAVVAVTAPVPKPALSASEKKIVKDLEIRPPRVPEKDSAGARGKGDGELGHRPKTPSKGAFRRLFSRNKADDLSP